VRFDPATGGVRATHGRRLGAILLSGGEDSRADPAAIEAALLEGVREHGLACSPGRRPHWRCAGARHSPAASIRGCRTCRMRRCWSGSTNGCRLCSHGKRRLGDIDPGSPDRCAREPARLGGAQRIDRLLPSHFQSPAGSRHEIDYEAEAGPTVTLRVQALFGLTEHPDRGRLGPADPGAHLAGGAADPDHQRPAGLLAGQLARGRQGDARPIPPASLARRPRRGRSDAAHQARQAAR
jgi:ATP-dependent helicase HrpB